MAGDPLRKVQPGDSLDPLKSAQTFNCFIDAAADFRARTQGLRQKAPEITPQRTIIPVKNMTGSQRARFDVAALDQSIFDINDDAGKERPAAYGLKPDEDTELGKIAVFLEPADVGDVARCCVSGVTVARVSFQEKWHKWADVKDDECTYLESRAEPGGAYILWSPGETGSQIVLVRLSNPPPVHFPAKITAVDSLGDNRYRYTFAEVEKTAAVHAGWTAKASGRSGYAYNLIETIGSATCVPAKVDETVRMEEVHFTGEGGDEETEYWFQYEEYDQTAGDSSGAYETIDVVVCGGWNRCGNYIVLPQKRIYLPPGTTIETLENDVIPIYQCESNGDEPPDSGGDSEPPDSDAGSSDFSFSIYSGLIVSGTLTPDATGTYTYRGYFNGKPFWGRLDNAYVLYWSDGAGCWMIYGGDAGYHWYQDYAPATPQGLYAPSALADGIATVTESP